MDNFDESDVAGLANLIAPLAPSAEGLPDLLQDVDTALAQPVADDFSTVGRVQLELHRPESTSLTTPLDEYREAIYGEVDRMCLRVGALLVAAKEDHPLEFRNWVLTEMPFGLETARRLMAVAVAYATLPKAVLDQLPRPFGALYALRKVRPEVLASAIEAGDISPSTTVAEARHLTASAANVSNGRHTKADIAAGVIIDSDPSDLHPMVLRALLKWCHQIAS